MNTLNMKRVLSVLTVCVAASLGMAQQPTSTTTNPTMRVNSVHWQGINGSGINILVLELIKNGVGGRVFAGASFNKMLIIHILEKLLIKISLSLNRTRIQLFLRLFLLMQ